MYRHFAVESIDEILQEMLCFAQDILTLRILTTSTYGGNIGNTLLNNERIFNFILILVRVEALPS